MQPSKAAGTGRANQLRRTGLAREYLGAARDFFGPPGVFSGLIGGRKKELVKPTTLNASKITWKCLNGTSLPRSSQCGLTLKSSSATLLACAIQSPVKTPIQRIYLNQLARGLWKVPLGGRCTYSTPGQRKFVGKMRQIQTTRARSADYAANFCSVRIDLILPPNF